jgi:hypothetical protein
MNADLGDDPPDRLVLGTLADHDGNVTAAWRRLANGGWRMPSLSTFRRRVARLTAIHPAPPLRPATDQPEAAGSRVPVQRCPRTSRGDVLVVAIDVYDRDVIRSWVVPNPSRKGTELAGTVREALALRSHLMLDLSEHAASSTGSR